MNGKKVIVIGGSGFMGSHTADELSNQNYQVTIFDCVKSKYVRSDQKMIVGDIFNREDVLKALAGNEIVFFFAGVADIADSIDDPKETIRMNILGVTQVLEAMIESKIKRFIYASSMYVYSSHGSFYRASKQCAEILIEAYQENYDISYTFLRYGSLYGPRSQKWNGLRRYVEEVVVKKSLNYSGSGKEIREYIHVQDAAKLSVEVLNRNFNNQAITLTGTQVLNSKSLVEMIFEIANVEYNAVFNSNINDKSHYEKTPYRYTPKNAKKLVPNEFIDIGQGILEIVEEIYSKKVIK